MPSIDSRNHSRNPVSAESLSDQSLSESPLLKPGREPRAVQLDRPLAEERMNEDALTPGSSEWMLSKIPR